MKRLLAVVLVGFVAQGCVSVAGTTLSAKELHYPVSLSPAIVDASGAPYTPKGDEILGHFEHSWTHWAMFWGLANLSGPLDLDALLSSEILNLAGNGVVNLTVETTFGPGYMLLAILPIIPETVRVRVEGDVVRARDASSQ